MKSWRWSGFKVGIPLDWVSLVAQMVKNLPAMRETGFDPSVGKILWRRKWLPTPVFLPAESHGHRILAGYSLQGHRVGHDWVTKSFTMGLLMPGLTLSTLDLMAKHITFILCSHNYILTQKVSNFTLSDVLFKCDLGYNYSIKMDFQGEKKAWCYLFKLHLTLKNLNSRLCNISLLS